MKEELDEEKDMEEMHVTAESENRKKEDPVDTVGMETPVPEISELPKEIFVDVCGAVKNPGVYSMSPDSRVFQAVEAAGGFLPEAAANMINQALPLSDGQQIYVPTTEEAEETKLNPTAEANEDSGKVNLNTADSEILQTLTGIGAAKAQAILAYREEHGGFSSVEELMNVPGIKESTFSNIKDKIVVE